MTNRATKLLTGNITDIGLNPNRPTNQDYYGTYQGEYGSLYIVCDGMGGHAGGDKASRIAVEEIRSYFESNQNRDISSISAMMRNSIDNAHKAIMKYANDHPDMKGMGTTLVMLLIKENQYWFASVGDSRIYLKRNEEIRQLTKDHSVVQGMVDAGIITPEQAQDHPDRNVITKALGAHSFEPDVVGPKPVYSNDVFLLCTDGLHQYFRSESEISGYLSAAPLEACQQLVDLAKERGGSDNITMQINRVVDGYKQTVAVKLPAKKTIKVFAACLFMVVLIWLVSVFWIRSFKPRGTQPVTDINVVEHKPARTPWFNILKGELKSNTPNISEQDYVGFIDNITQLNKTQNIELLTYSDFDPEANLIRIAYVSQNGEIMLLKPNLIGQLYKSGSKKFHGDDVNSLLLIAIKLLERNRLQVYEHNPYSSDEMILIPESVFESAKNMLSSYKSDHYGVSNFQKSIVDIKSCVKLSQLSLVWINPRQAPEERLKDPTTHSLPTAIKKATERQPIDNDSLSNVDTKAVVDPTLDTGKSDETGEGNE